jgi:hypothetical protein
MQLLTRKYKITNNSFQMRQKTNLGHYYMIFLSKISVQGKKPLLQGTKNNSQIIKKQKFTRLRLSV